MAAPHFPLAHHYASEGEQWMYGRGSHDRLTDSGDWRERIVLTEHRYMREDLRLGLSLLVSVAELAGVATPLARAFLAIGGAICGEDFLAGGRTLASLGLGHLDRDGAAEPCCAKGFRAMTAARPTIACLGAGRMGRGIAVAFAYAGHAVTMIDVKARSAEAFATLEAEALGEVSKTLASLARFGLLAEDDADAIIARVSVVPAQDMAAALAGAGIVFEGVPEVVDLKREVLAAASKCVGPDIVIASTTSTILVDDLSGAVENPSRFLNVHWLNPAYLIPLVEISPGAATDPDVIAKVKALLEGIGKVPVVCAATPGFIVPRIQALAMNEAARMVEEGVASAEDIDKAIRYGFGFRYAVLGLLEFIDWGGGDILYYASRYLEGALAQRPLPRARGDLQQHARRPHRHAHRRRLSRLLRPRCRCLPRAAPRRDGRVAPAFRPGEAAGAGQGCKRPLRASAEQSHRARCARVRMDYFATFAPGVSGSTAHSGRVRAALPEHILQHAFLHHRDAVEFDRRTHHRQIEMP